MNVHTARRWWVPLGLAAGLAAALPIAAHAYLGTYSRYIADDFCTASTLRRFGLLASQSYWYETWTGRYSYTFAVSLAQSIGPALTPWLTLLILIAWIVFITYAAQAMLGLRGIAPVAVALATVHVFSTLDGSPSVYQSLYWQTGMVTYTLPLVLSVVYAAWLWGAGLGRQGPRNTAAACTISLAAGFLLGGFSETYATLQTSALVLLLLSMPWLIARGKRSRAASLAAAGLAGSLLAGLTIALAPGTGIRRALMPAAPEFMPWAEATLRDGYLFLARTVKGSPEAIVLSIALPCVLVLLFASERDPKAQTGKGAGVGSLLPLLLLPIATPILMLSTIAPYEFAISSYPDARVLITTMFVLITGLAAWGAYLGKLLAGSTRMRSFPARLVALSLAVLVVVGLLAVSVRSASTILDQAEAARDYARSWDTRDRNLRQAAAAESGQVPAASLRHMGGLAEIGHDPEEWINRCVAGTYGVESVVAK